MPSDQTAEGQTIVEMLQASRAALPMTIEFEDGTTMVIHCVNDTPPEQAVPSSPERRAGNGDVDMKETGGLSETAGEIESFRKEMQLTLDRLLVEDPAKYFPTRKKFTEEYEELLRQLSRNEGKVACPGQGGRRDVTDQTVLVEKVARAIARAATDGAAPPGICRHWMKEPTAAIAVMREPTRPMIDALQSYAVCDGHIEEGWAAAMDAALEEVTNAE